MFDRHCFATLAMTVEGYPIIPERNQRRMAGSRLRSQPQTLQRQFCTPEESTVNLREAT
ncbi:hypothetical protein GCM10017612_25070 [Novosphingobium resinovorum]|jgi:hypothetical protein|nr:hypothetical protein GCM10017612_25070 [Novosphingobium resinovorum]